MFNNRRKFLSGLASLSGGILFGKSLLGQQATPSTEPVPFETPDVDKLPFRVVNGAKEFHLVAEPIETEFIPGKTVKAWGYNGSTPGPTIEINEGDRVRIVFHNNLPEVTTVHWHGLEVPTEMDGVPGIGQDPIPSGGIFTYEFNVNQNGTFFYHSHFPMQEMMGMIGFFVVHPKQSFTPRVDRDFGLILQEWGLLPNNPVPNTLAMEFNWLTLNGKSGPATTPMLAKVGERVRIRFVNLGMDHHPMHLHGYQYVVTGTEGGRIPQSAWYPGNTAIVGVAQARDIEFEATRVGDWMIHCHLPHHMMNQMISMVGPVSQLGTGTPASLRMNSGMGIVQGNALDPDTGPALGRGLGFAAEHERPTSPIVGGLLAAPAPASQNPASPQQEAAPPPGHEGHDMHAMSSAEALNTPGYPQDMWMPMDEMAAGKPEVLGLRKDWTGAMMGMMTLIRVLPADKYDEIMELKRRVE